MQTRATRGGLALTVLGLGAAQLGNLFRETTEHEVTNTVDTAWDSGIRYFDTAPHYGVGLSERRLGERLRARPRDEFAVSSKVGRLLVPSPSTAHLVDEHDFAVPRDPVREWDFSRDGVLRSVEATLTRTGLDRIDIFYLHDPDDHFEQASSDGIQALIDLREQGVVRAVGAGMNHASPLAELIRRADIDIVMIAGRFTLLDHEAHADLLPTALEHGVGVVVAGVYNSGLLGRERPAADSHYDYRPVTAKTLRRANLIADACEAHGVTLPVAALAWPLLHPAVVSVVVGARGTDQVAQNVARFNTPVPEALWADLRSAGLLPTTTTTGSPR